MARDATETRNRLLRAGERRFASEGIGGAKISDIVRDAGQRNDSAVGYHFGSRQGLLTAIVAKHMAQMEAHRVVPPADAGLHAVVEAIVAPTAALLSTEDGRDFLRIMEQLAPWSGLGTARPNEVLHNTAIGAQLERLLALLERRGEPVLARERIALLVTFLTAALADRARSREAGTRQRLNHERFVGHLVNVLTGALAV